MTKTLMVWSFVVTLLLPLLWLKVQIYVPLSSLSTGLICKLPLESCVNLSSSGIPSCLFQTICGVGAPSALQFIIPEESAIILCWILTSVNLAVGRNNNFGLFVSQSYIITILCGGVLATRHIRAVDSRQISKGSSPHWGSFMRLSPPRFINGNWLNFCWG